MKDGNSALAWLMKLTLFTEKTRAKHQSKPNKTKNTKDLCGITAIQSSSFANMRNNKLPFQGTILVLSEIALQNV